jgi:hypothetical protein
MGRQIGHVAGTSPLGEGHGSRAAVQDSCRCGPCGADTQAMGGTKGNCPHCGVELWRQYAYEFCPSCKREIRRPWEPFANALMILVLFAALMLFVILTPAKPGPGP